MLCSSETDTLTHPNIGDRAALTQISSPRESRPFLCFARSLPQMLFQAGSTDRMERNAAKTWDIRWRQDRWHKCLSVLSVKCSCASFVQMTFLKSNASVLSGFQLSKYHSWSQCGGKAWTVNVLFRSESPLSFWSINAICGLICRKESFSLFKSLLFDVPFSSQFKTISPGFAAILMSGTKTSHRIPSSTL